MMTMAVTTNADRLAVEFRTKAELLPGQMAKAVAHGARMIKGSIIAHASGRPGPEIITSDYVNSWGIKMTFRGPSAEAEIGTHSEQGYRLEMGYHDTDSLGRTYDQPPFPHVEVGMMEVMPDVMVTMEVAASL